MIAQQFTQQQLIAILSWQVEMGADEAVLDQPSPYLQSSDDISGSTAVKIAVPTPVSLASQLLENQLPSVPLASPASAPAPLNPAVSAHLHLMDSLSDLATALGQLDSCPLKHTASTMCFADGNAGARLMIIGEAPGRDEDRLGVPFVGAAGQLLDHMLASIGLSRSGVYLTNFLPWRPPGNRPATSEETDMLLPFLYRHIQLANPELVVILGGTPAKTILKNGDNILKLRGRWQDIDYGDGEMRPTMVSLHPAYLIRSPAQKRLAFEDWCGLYHRLGNTTSPPVA